MIFIVLGPLSAPAEVIGIVLTAHMYVLSCRSGGIGFLSSLTAKALNSETFVRIRTSTILLKFKQVRGRRFHDQNKLGNAVPSRSHRKRTLCVGAYVHVLHVCTCV